MQRRPESHLELAAYRGPVTGYRKPFLARSPVHGSGRTPLTWLAALSIFIEKLSATAFRYLTQRPPEAGRERMAEVVG